jgi:hypothetical protein
MTIQEFLDGCQTIIGDDDDTFEDVLFEALKQVLGKVQLVTKTRGFKKITTLSLSSGAQTVDLSSLDDFQKELAIYYVEGGRRVEVVKRDDEQFNLLMSTTETAPPAFYRIYGQTLEVNALADKAYTLNLEYISVESEGIAKGDTFTYPTKVIEVIRLGVYEIGYGHREEEKKEDKYANAFLSAMQFLEAEYDREETPDYVEETED